MKILYYDCFSGISGDMNLGAMVDLGVDGDYLVRELSKLELDGEYKIEIKKGVKNGLSGTKVDVILPSHEHGHSHRNLKDIEEIINKSGLSAGVKNRSLAMFRQIAQAEAQVHGEPIDQVHFHEVGAIDSIVDLVGAAIALDYLSVDKIMASPVQVGGGFVKCAHGVIPVPAPATVEILKGIPIRAGLVQFETTTPTGAAILAANAAEFTDKTEFVIEKVGYGLGSRDLDIPNVLRVYLGERESPVKQGAAAGTEGEPGSPVVEEQYLLETNIDDMNPELFGYVEERLFAAGALDVFKTPIVMKKGRLATKLSVLVDKKGEKHVLEIIFNETSSIGVRKFAVEKTMLPRKTETIATRYGSVAVKVSYYNGKPIKYKAEYEDCRRIAEQSGISIAQVYKEIDNSISGGQTGR